MGSRHLRVLNVIAEDRVGGPQVRIVRMAKALEQRGIETVVALPKGEGGFAGLLRQAEIPFHEIPRLHRPRATWNPAVQLRWAATLWPAVHQLMRIIKQDDISVVHQNDVTHIHGALAGKLAGCKVVWHVNGMTYPLVYRAFKPLVHLLADVVVASSQAMGEEYLGRGSLGTRFKVLYPPLERTQSAPESGQGLRQELGIPKAASLIAMIGNLSPLKGHLYFVRAARLIAERAPEARFLIVGLHLENRQGYSREVAREAHRLGLEDRLVFTGFRKDIPEVLAAIDMLVHPSLSESFGMVVAEAMAVGKPVVASAVGGLREIVLDGQTGLLVPPRDPPAIAGGVIRLLEDPSYSQKLAQAGRDYVWSRFSPEQCAVQYQELYQSAVNGMTSRRVSG